MHPISYTGNFDDGSLDVRIGNQYVLTVDLDELNQNKPNFQKRLNLELVEAIEDSFKAGREYEKRRINKLLNK